MDIISDESTFIVVSDEEGRLDYIRKGEPKKGQEKVVSLVKTKE